MSHRSSCALVACIATGLAGIVPPVHAATPTAIPAAIVLAAEDGVTVHDAWARASAGAATTGAAYLTLMGGGQPDTLVSVSTPAAAIAEPHETINDNGVMKMRAVAALPIPPHQTVAFSPGGYHIMLMGLKKPLVAGQSFPLTLTFAHTAPVTVQVKIQPMGRAAPMGGHDMMHMQ